MLIEDAAHGRVNDTIKTVARDEGIQEDRLAQLVSHGEVVIPRNAAREAIGAVGIGRLLTCKVNANVGTSGRHCHPDEEVEKAHAAVECGADAVMDLSTGPHGGEVLSRLLKELTAPVGTVPVYDAFSGGWDARSIADVDADDFIRSVEKHCKEGVDFVTLHAGVNLDSYKRLLASPRVCGVVSRGGSLTLAWMAHNEQENPLYEQFDYVLELLAEQEVTASLGDGMRPGALVDASDRPKFMEFITLGELAKRCRESGVQAMVEGPGHVPLDEIAVAVRSMKHLCDGAPLYLLGPLVTDIAPGYDHVVAAMGGAVAGMHGADFLCMVSPAEHLGLPTIDEVREGTRVARIAAHVADTVREGVSEKARDRDRKMAYKRAALDWEGQFELSIDPEKARSRHECEDAGDECSMCGDLCVFKLREQWSG